MQLLAAHAPLANLKTLDFTDILLESVTTAPTDGMNGIIAPQPGATATAATDRLSPFSALTASSKLESLSLVYRTAEKGDDPVQPLPTGAVAAMLRPGRQLTALTGERLRDNIWEGLLQRIVSLLHCTLHTYKLGSHNGCRVGRRVLSQ